MCTPLFIAALSKELRVRIKLDTQQKLVDHEDLLQTYNGTYSKFLT